MRLRLALMFFTAACGLDPDGKSGADARRDVAQVIPLDEWVTDENGVSFGDGDRTDWKKIVTPKSGALSVQIAIDKTDTAIVAALYDRYGQRLGEKTKARGGTEPITFDGEAKKGHVFVSITAKGNGDTSAYSIRASMGGGYGVGDIPPPE